MKTIFLKTSNLLIALAMTLSFASISFAQISPSEPVIEFSFCDATFEDKLPMISLPANTDMSNLAALGPIDQNNYNKDYFWEMGDGTLDTGKIVLHNYKKPGKYLVTLHTIQHINGFVSSFDVDCINSQWVTVGVIDNSNTCDASFHPWILATTDYPSSYSEVVGYDASNYNYDSYTWDFGDGTKGTGKSVRHHFVNDGKYLVSLTVKDENCEDTKTMWMTKKGVYISIDSTVRCNANLKTFVNDNSVRFYDQPIQTLVAIEPDGHYETWNWDFGDGQSAFGNNVTHTYAKAGKYMATLTKSSYYNPCFGNPACFAAPVLKCTKTYQIEVVIGEPESKCKAEISYTITDKTLEIKDNIVYAYTMRDINTITERRHWDFGDGSDTVSNNFVTHTYASAGKYRVRLIKSIMNDPCPFIHDTLPRCMAMPFLICMDTTYFDVEIGVQKPTCKAYFETKIDSNKVTVEAKSTGKSIKYSKVDFGDGTFAKINDSVFTISHTYSQKGKYETCLYISTIDSILPYVRYLNMCNDLVCKTITISDSASKPIMASIYPNPASDYMTISVQNNSKKMDLKLYDQTGKLKKEVFEILSNSKEIDTNGLENGLYFYTLSDGENVVLKGKIAVSK